MVDPLLFGVLLMQDAPDHDVLGFLMHIYTNT